MSATTAANILSIGSDALSTAVTVESDMTNPSQPIERIPSRESILGENLPIARALPHRTRRTIGAWCFLDHVGPAEFVDGQGMHVGSHPHTHLQTFTWMIEGDALHRDSLGNEMVIKPGEVNLMTAGYGISHTEDSMPYTKRMHAAQMWIALPLAVADMPPAFVNYKDLPCWNEQGAQWTVMAGEYAGKKSPATIHSPLLGMEVLAGDADVEVKITLQPDFEYGLMALEGSFELQGENFPMDELAYLSPQGGQIQVKLPAKSRLLILGGEPYKDPLVIWWNFLGPNMEAIRGYREQWVNEDARFGVVPNSEGRRLSVPALP